MSVYRSTTQRSPRTPALAKRGRRTAPVACAAAVALALLSAAGGWELGRHSRESASPAAVSAPALPATVAGLPAAQPAAVAPAAAAPAEVFVPVRHSSEHPSIVLTDTAARAAEVSDEIDAANALRAQEGVPPLDSTIVQISSPEDLANALQEVVTQNDLRDALGLPEFTLQDLRSGAAQ